MISGGTKGGLVVDPGHQRTVVDLSRRVNCAPGDKGLPLAEPRGAETVDGVGLTVPVPQNQVQVAIGVYVGHGHRDRGVDPAAEAGRAREVPSAIVVDDLV